MSEFQKGDVVEVQEGTYCPGYESLDLSGWRGRVVQLSETKEGEPLVTVRWDSKTLSRMPEDYILDSEEENLDWSALTLYEKEVKPTEPRDTEQEANRTRRNLESLYSWYDMEEEGKRIFEVLKGLESTTEDARLSRWEEHLNQKLDYPFEAEIKDTVGVAGSCYGERVRVHEIIFRDDHVGLIVRISSEIDHTQFPLCNLRIPDETSEAYQPLNDYCVWFANH